MRTSNAVVWLGTQSSGLEYFETQARAERMLEANPDLISANSYDAKAESRFGEYEEYIQVHGNLAIVPIEGSMRAKESWFTRMVGIMTYDTISNIMATLVADGGINTVLMDIDSPGGAAKGLDTALDGIAAARDAGLEIVSHTAGSMASAAYWIGSAADVVGATEAAEVGSVGVIAVHAEQSERLKEQGIGVTVLRKGDEKALATPYEKLTEKGKNQILESMDRAFSQFVGAVSANRGIPEDTVREKIATGAVFGSAEAVELGMIDEVVTYNDLVSRYVEASGPSRSGAGNQQWSEAAMHKKPIVNAGEISPEDAAIAVAAGADPKEVRPLIASGEESHEELAELEVVKEDAEASDTDSDAEGEEGGEDEETPAAAAASSTELAGFQAMVTSLNEQLVEAKVQVNTLEAKVEDLKTGNIGLRQIALEQTQRLRISLGQPGDITDLEAQSDVALVQSHRQTLNSFMERFNVGATSQEAETDSTPEETSTRLQAAASRLTRIK